MSLSFTRVAHTKWGDIKAHIYQVSFDSSYPTGGEVVAASDFGLDAIVAVFTESVASAGAAVSFAYDATNKKLKAFWSDYDAVADGGLIQVPDTTDLSAVTVVCIVLGA